MNQKEIRRICKWFQETIGLAGWNIDVHIDECPPSLLDGDRSRSAISEDMGVSATHLRRHDAQIWINPVKASEDVFADEFWMATLMHELMHCAFDESGIEHGEHQEYLIDRLSIALATNHDG